MLFMLMVLFLVSSSFVMIFFIINTLFSLKSSEKNKVSPFESGFTSVSKLFKSFSVHFFIVMVIFVIFDLEVVLILGLVMSDMESGKIFLLVSIFMVGGLYVEWGFSKLSWMI